MNTAPPRKAVTAWEVEPMEENGDEFFVLTFHHGLGEMTRLDLGPEDLAAIADALLAQTTCPQHPGSPTRLAVRAHHCTKETP